MEDFLPYDDTPDQDDDEAWFTCESCDQQFERPPLILFTRDAKTGKASEATELCYRCFGEVTGHRILIEQRQRVAR